MRIFAAFLLHEARTQARSLRFRVVASAYLVLAFLPAAAAFATRGRSESLLGAATYAGSVAVIAPVLTALLALVTSVDAVTREREEGSLAVTGLAALTNARFLLSRWGAVVAILLPLTLLPFAGALALAAADGRVPLRLAPALVPWALHVAPVALAGSALGTGLGTMGGGMVAAAFLGVLLHAIVVGSTNAFLVKRAFQLHGPNEWLAVEGLGYRSLDLRWGWLGAASEGPLDLARTAVDLLALGAPLLGLAAAALALSASFVGRSRGDRRPLRVSATHPLRGTAALVNRLREEHAPDPRPARADVLLAAAGAAALAAGLGFSVARGLRFERAAHERLRVERAGRPNPSPVGLVALSADVQGTLGADGALRCETAILVRNDGPAPAARMAFSLNASLSVEAFREGRRLPAERLLDRLSVPLEPPLLPGAETRLTFRVAGTPRRVRFAFERPPRSFVAAFERSLRTTFAAELSDLSRSVEERAASARRVSLEAPDLLPVPRYTTWALTPPPVTIGGRGLEVREEEIRPESDVSLSLAVPRGLFLADGCGGTSGGGRLEGRCRIALADLAVAGGPLALVAGEARPRVACLPVHRAQAQRHLPAFAEAARLAAGAWRGLDPLGSSVVLEVPPPPSLDPFDGMRSFWWNGRGNAVTTRGKLVLVDEAAFVRVAPLDPEALAADSVAAALSSRRPVVPAEERLVRELFRYAVLARLGRGPRNGAVVERNRASTEPLLRADGWSAYRSRLEAVLHEIRRRCGEGAFVSGVERFLARPGRGTTRELLDEIGGAAGVDLFPLYRDVFDGSALPVLTLGEVRAVRRGEIWEVTGSVRNEGTGEARCPVVLTTEFDPVRTEVTVGPQASAPFRLQSRVKPRVLQLDPGEECYRLRRVGIVETADLLEPR